jgi:hypothetical protein
MLIAATAHLHGFLYDTFDPGGTAKVLLYVGTWLVLLGCLAILFLRKRDERAKWTTQDVFTLAILAVMLLAWDSFLNDQLFGPLISSVPVAGNFLNWIQLPDLPYLFIVMVAVATIRKPGTVTALIFVKRLLGEIMFTTHGVRPQIWPDALDEGVFADLYIMMRGERLLDDAKAILLDGFAIGFLRAVPNVIIGDAVLDPFLNGQIHTYASFIGTNIAGGGGILGNGLGNGIEAAITAPLAVRVARSVGALAGAGGAPRATKARAESLPAPLGVAGGASGAGGGSSLATSRVEPIQSGLGLSSGSGSPGGVLRSEVAGWRPDQPGGLGSEPTAGPLGGGNDGGSPQPLPGRGGFPGIDGSGSARGTEGLR